MWGFPYGTLLGLVLVLAVLVTTVFVPAFRMTLVFGVPFLALLSIAYLVWKARRKRSADPQA